MSNSTQNIKEWAGDPMHPRDSTQNDEIEVDGETYTKWDTQTDWEKRFDSHYGKYGENDFRSCSIECELQIGKVKDFIRKELADARREIISKVEKIPVVDSSGLCDLIAKDDVLATLRKDDKYEASVKKMNEQFNVEN